MFPSTVNSLAYPRKRVRQPRHVRASSPNSIRSAVPASVGVGGVQLDLGRPGGARLQDIGGKWGWEWVGRDDPDIRIKMGEEGLLLFPGERETEQGQTNELSVRENIAAVSNYLEERLELYDHLGVKDLIAQEMEDHFNSSSRSIRGSQSMPNLNHHTEGLLNGETILSDSVQSSSINVYEGSKLAVVVNSRARLVKAVACFPTGPLGSELNVSPFLPMSNTHVTNGPITRFVPSAIPVKTFSTPILQLASSPVVSTHRLDREATCLVVRLQSTTHLLHLIPIPTFIPPSDSAPVTLEDIAAIGPSDTAGLHHVDIALDPTNFGRCLIVDECGGVWLWTGRKVEQAERLFHSAKLVQIRQAVTTTRDSFFRVAWGTRPGTVLVMSRVNLVLLDLEGHSPPETLLELQGDGRMFTSIDKTALERQVTYTAMATTYEVLWVDELSSGTPVLSWTHDYGGGKVKDLEVTTIHVGDQAAVLLSSSTESLIMAFHGPSDPPISSSRLPYAMSVPKGTALPLHSLGLINTYPNSLESNTTLLLGISLEGAVWSIPLASMPDTDRKSKRKAALRIRWTDAVQARAKRKDPIVDEDDDDVAGTRYKDVNLRWAWLEINEPLLSSETDFAFEELQRHLREADAPYEHLMTAGELARDMMYGQITDTRSNLLRSLQVNADISDEMASSDLTRYISLIWQLESRKSEIGKIFPASDAPSRRENPARHITDIYSLASDLALSRPILNSEELNFPATVALKATQTSQADSPEDLFARVAGQLSLNDKEPGPATFSYLFPRFSDNELTTLDAPGTSDPLQSLSARNLLEEWTLGSDPKEYDWKPWDETAPRLSATIAATPVTPQRRDRAIRPLPTPRSPARMTYSQPQPPTLRPAASTPTLFRVPPNVARSSPPPEVPTSSFDMSGFVQTQAEPGKFGARAGGGGKKKVKKRVGGF